MTVKQKFFIFSLLAVVLIVAWSTFWGGALWAFIVIIPLILVGLHDVEIQQYFVESDTNGMPISREYRALVYQRAKGVQDTRPFGTVFDVYRDGAEWINHSLAPKAVANHDPRVMFGEGRCSKPYAASPLNISAMSYGALSKTAVLALNKGAKMGDFAHNTGEGGLSPYHLEPGGDIIWQIGTGYFGCRNAEGGFDEAKFIEGATKPVVKMIEIKLSQGAKPGHGGILPAAKLTEEIAAIRHVPMGHDVVSPAAHSAFNSPIGLLEFVVKLRECSGGKPVGFKLCIGEKREFLAICKAMLETGIVPDFITIDGSEGGTGAAPVELTNSVGTPLRDGLIFVNSALIGIGLRQQIRLIATGKAMSAFHIVRLLALGADTVNSARAMMFALGCIQSRSCNTDKCPTGITTQNPARYKNLDVEDKSKRVFNYHHATILNIIELLAAAGLEHIEELRPHHINHRVSGTVVKRYDELYPVIPQGCLLTDDCIPDDWGNDWAAARAVSW